MFSLTACKRLAAAPALGGAACLMPALQHHQLYSPYRIHSPSNSTSLSLRRSATLHHSSPIMSSALVSRRNYTDKLLIGSTAAFTSSLTVLAIFHLLVTPVSSTIAAATIASATASGALVIFEGNSDEGGTTFGAVIGLFFGAIGGYYAKSSKEPWRK